MQMYKAKKLIIVPCMLCAIFALSTHAEDRVEHSNAVVKKSSKALAVRNKLMKDRDKDGLPDSFEKELGTDPRNADTGQTGVLDSEKDSLGIGMTNMEAFTRGLIEPKECEKSDCSLLHPRKKPWCTKTRARGCRKPYCTRRGQVNCLKKPKKPVTTPTPQPSVQPTNSVPTIVPTSPSVTPGVQPTPPVVVPTATPTVRPTQPPATATPTPAGSFDSNGNTTKFGIPAGLVGNISEGQTSYSAKCSGCHGSMGTRNFSQLKNAMTGVGSMRSLSSMPDAEIADLTAYLNRNTP